VNKNRILLYSGKNKNLHFLGLKCKSLLECSRYSTVMRNSSLWKLQVSFWIRYACEETVTSTVQYVSFGGTSQVHVLSVIPDWTSYVDVFYKI